VGCVFLALAPPRVRCMPLGQGALKASMVRFAQCLLAWHAVLLGLQGWGLEPQGQASSCPDACFGLDRATL